MKMTILVALSLSLFVALVVLGFVFDNAWVVMLSVVPMVVTLTTVFHNKIFRR